MPRLTRQQIDHLLAHPDEIWQTDSFDALRDLRVIYKDMDLLLSIIKNDQLTWREIMQHVTELEVKYA